MTSPTDAAEQAREIHSKCIVQVIGFDDVESGAEFERLIISALQSARDAERARIVADLKSLEQVEPENMFFRCDVYATIASQSEKENEDAEV